MENAGNVKAAEDIWLVLKTDDPWSASRIALKHGQNRTVTKSDSRIAARIATHYM